MWLFKKKENDLEKAYILQDKKEKEMGGTFFQQFMALTYKNLLLKKRNKSQLFQELFFPLYFIGILAMTKAFLSLDPKPIISSFPVHQIQDLKQNSLLTNILVSPDTPEVQSIANESANFIQQLYNMTSPPQLTFFTDSSSMESTAKYNNSEAAGLQFQYDSSSTLSYAIRMPIDKIGNTESSTYYKDMSQCRGGNGEDSSSCDANRYLHTGFSVLQLATDTALMRDYFSNKSLQIPLQDLSVRLMPMSNYQPDTSYIQIISSIYFVIAYSPFVSFLTVNLVNEKEKKIREGMKMMGLRDSAFWLSWGSLYFVMILLVTIVVTIIAQVSKFFQNSNLFIFFLILMLYGTSIITLSYIITPFFQKAQSAGGAASLSTMIVSLFYLVISLTRTISSTGEISYTIPPVGRAFLCLLSPCGVALAIDQSIFLDITKGMNFETITEGEFPLYVILIILVVDIVLYFFLAVYLDNVIPGNYGPRFPPYYPFMKSYWFGDKKKQYKSNADDTELFFGNDVENVSPDTRQKSGLRIYNITKEFKNDEGEMIKAVNGLSLEMYEGQITCLLGHNGAGKTTLLNVLSGMMSPTSGTATVQGYDISNSVDVLKMRSMTGVCPQHNILFDQLTCVEHLQLFSRIRGLSDNEEKMMKEIEQSLQNVDLYDQKDTFAKDLSGGQKRKLSVAIAIIGDPKIIYLDEPTAGMDPYSRRHLWSVLKEKKEGKVILLTTHFMDEADILADRKAFISKGKLRCCGSSLFLKSRFGIGYHLNMVVEPGCNESDVTNFVKSHVDGGELNRIHGKELAYTLPLNQVSRFSVLFTELEKRSTEVSTKAESLGIKSYGVSMTSLEEVFLKLEEDDNTMDLHELVNMNNTSPSHMDNKISPLTVSDNHNNVNIQIEQEQNILDIEKDPTNLKSRQFWALVMVRIRQNLRYPGALLFGVFLPITFVIVGIVVNKTTKTEISKVDPTPLNLQSLPIYARFNSSIFSGAPHLLVQNSDGSALSNIWLSEIEKLYITDSFDNNTNLRSVAPHYVGVDQQKFSLANGSSALLETVSTIYYNATATHSIPMMMNLLSNSLLNAQAVLSGVQNTTIKTTNLPWTALKNNNRYSQAAFSSTILVAMAFITVGSSFGPYLVRDRESKCRSQLRISGLPFSMYWVSSFFVDLIKFSIPAVCCIIIVLAADLDSLGNYGAIISMLLLFITYIPAGVLFAYVFSFIFKKTETAMSFMTMFFFLLGFMPYLAVSLVDMIKSAEIAKYIHYPLCILDPPYVIFGGLYFIDKIYRNTLYNPGTTVDPASYFFFDNAIIFTYIVNIFHIVFFFFALRVLDIRFTGGDVRDALPFLTPKEVVETKNTDIMEDEDDDVMEERQRVKMIQDRNPVTMPVALVENLRKEFVKNKSKSTGCDCSKKAKERKIKAAVRNAAFAVDEGEVFGLLGPNGAGKTTVLNMMTAEIGPTKGKVMVGGYDVHSCMSEAFSALGFCPQHDALWDQITLREHIMTYAAIRGVPADKMETVADWFIENLKVKEHEKKHAKKLSGGTKRKLSYAISMLGQPRAVLLDEPSTGMDPVSKRFLWDTISSSFNNKQRGAILTTHYMEEADALCSRVGIMVNGKLECIGATQHLKYKFGSGYLLEIKLLANAGTDTNEERMDRLEDYIHTLFPDAIVHERFGLRAQYKVPKSNVKSLAQVFTALEEGKRSHDMEEYNFSQSSLEQVFLEFAKKQLDENATDEEEERAKQKSPKRESVRSTASQNGTSVRL